MCTVTFIPVKDQVYITSNRDEKVGRKEAIQPSMHQHNNRGLIYPRDAAAGGTWIAMRENGDAAVLLNGAFIYHASEPPYRKSRGILFLDVFSTDYSTLALSKIDLTGIEPFTLILFENGLLYEFRWDGSERYCKQLPAHRPHIWSSATLYDGFVSKKREQWFAEFMNSTPNPTQHDITRFHQLAGDGDKHNDLVMDRDGIYATVSITSIRLNADRGVMKYYDLKENKTSEIKIELLNTVEAI